MHQLTLRQIPPSLERRLRTYARRSGKDIESAAVSLLSVALGLHGSGGLGRKRELSRFAGTMSDEDVREFEESTRAFAVIDKAAGKA